MSTFHFQPIKGQARQILEAILKSPEVASCHLKETLALRLACEEIVMNVTTYAYPEGADGFLDVDIQKTDRITIRFEDGGVPFNPLEQKTPNTKLSWKKRRVGTPSLPPHSATEQVSLKKKSVLHRPLYVRA